MSDTAAAKRHAKVAKLAWENKEPMLNPLDYQGSLAIILNFFNIEVDNELKKSWVITYWKAQGKSVKGMDKIHECYFHQLGVLVRCLNHGYVIDTAHLAYIDAKYDEFVTKIAGDHEEKVVTSSPRLTKSEKDALLAAEIATQIDAEIDEIATNDKKTVNLKSLIAGKNVDASAGKLLLDMYARQLAELQEALLGKDDQLKEGYSHLSKKTIRVMHDFLSELKTLCEQAKTIVRKARKVKAKPAAVIVAKVKYLKEYPQLGLKSIPAERMIGADVVYLFNTKYRKLYRYVAAEGQSISVKGQTLVGWDVVKSGGKTIRKPELMFAGLVGETKRQFNKKFEEVKSVLAKPTGRLGEETIIIVAF